MSRLESSPQSVPADRAIVRLAETPRGLWMRALQAAGAVRCRLDGDALSVESIDPSVEWMIGIPASWWREPNALERIVHPDDRPAVADVRRAVRDGLETIDAKFRVATVNGSSLGLRLCAMRIDDPSSAYPIYDAYLVADVGALVDQTRDVLDRLSIATDAGIMSLWEMDVESLTIDADVHLSALVGFEPGELTTRDQWRARVHPDDLERVDAFERTALAAASAHATNRLPVIEFRIVHRDGSVRWVENRVSIRHDGAGRAIRVFGAVHDISDRVRHRESRDAAAELNRVVLASFPGHVAVLDEHGTIVAANDAWRALNDEHGCDCVPVTSVGVNYLDACRIGIAAGHQAAREILEAIGRTLRSESERERIEHACTGGLERSFVLLVERLKRPWLGVIVAYLDVSERARGERALQQARHELMHAARFAVAGELAAGISHDLRQPLTALQMDLAVALHMLRLDVPVVSEAVQSIEDAAGEHARMTASLRVLDDLVASREPHRVAVALGDIAAEVVRLLRTAAAARHVELRLQCDSAVPMIRADPNLVREAVLSLVLEAVETITPNDDGRAEVTIAIVPADNGVVELSVSYRRRLDADVDSRWALSVARSVLEAHFGALSAVGDASQRTTIRTLWPIAIDRIDPIS